MQQVKATAKYIRMSPRKTRLVVDLVRGLSVQNARHQLMFSQKAAARPVLKVLESAVANAKNNHGQDVSDFYVTVAYVDEGPTIKRYRPRAHGRSAPIRKRTSHITLFVGPQEEIGKMKEVFTKKELKAKRKASAVAKQEEKSKETKKKKPAAKKKTKAKDNE